jgi:hypothetical protein
MVRANFVPMGGVGGDGDELVCVFSLLPPLAKNWLFLLFLLPPFKEGETTTGLEEVGEFNNFVVLSLDDWYVAVGVVELGEII